MTVTVLRFLKLANPSTVHNTFFLVEMLAKTFFWVLCLTMHCSTLKTYDQQITAKFLRRWTSHVRNVRFISQ